MSLARDQNDVAGRSDFESQRDRRAPVGLDQVTLRLARLGRRNTAEARALRPASTSAIIASGSSLRGLSEVRIARSASRPAIPPISGRLPRSRSPPQPKTQTAAADSVRGAREHRLERVGLMRIVDQHRHSGRSRHRLQSAGGPGHRRNPPPPHPSRCPGPPTQQRRLEC